MSENDINKNAKFLPLAKRNAEIAEVAIRELNKLVYNNSIQLQKQQAAISSLIERVGFLENALNIQRMNLKGLGPTVK